MNELNADKYKKIDHIFIVNVILDKDMMLSLWPVAASQLAKYLETVVSVEPYCGYLTLLIILLTRSAQRMRRTINFLVLFL